MDPSGIAHRGRSPARPNLRVTPARNTTKIGIPTGLAKRGQLEGRIKDRDSPLIEHDYRATPSSRKGQYTKEMAMMKNSPEHLYGVDKTDDILGENCETFKSKKENSFEEETDKEDNQESQEVEKTESSRKWGFTSWKKAFVIILSIIALLQAVLLLKDNSEKFEGLHLSNDASICLRSHEELRKKLALAFELINESGKLFKQLERQSKHQFEQMEIKQKSSDIKAAKEVGDIKRQIDAFKSYQTQRDNTDFSKFSDKEIPVDMNEIHSLVEMALARYDADKIGIPDYALESAGGRIHVPHHSQTHSYGWPIMKVFGVVIWQDTRTPREVIKPETLPGNCWPLEGSSGYVVIKLATSIIPSMVTMEHLHPSLAKFSDDAWKSMPKNVSVFSWSDENGKEKMLLGTYTYVQHGKSRQTFPVQNLSDQPVEFIELRIDSNYGNMDYTCVYRFRVHGETLHSNDTGN